MRAVSSADTDTESTQFLTELWNSLQGTNIEDRTAAAPKDRREGMRDLKKVHAVVLHQMAFSRGNDPARYDTVPAHFAILPDGRILQLHPEAALIRASNGVGRGSVAVTFAGNFPDTNGRCRHAERLGCHRPTTDQINAGRYLVEHLWKKIGLTHVLAHRQASRDHANDPGPAIWAAVGQWAVGRLGLTDGGPGFAIGTGTPIPDRWRISAATGGASEIPWGSGSYPQPAYEESLLRSAIRAGETNENMLANLIFFKRHPERNGRLISREGDGSSFGTLSTEWLRIRDTQVRPLLTGTSPGRPPGTPPGPAPYPGPRLMLLRDALVTLKRAETRRKADAGYRPAGPDRQQIDAAAARVRAQPKYRVNGTTYRVTFAEQPGRKVRVETIEDFVLFVEAVEAQYPAAPAAHVVSEIRQIWFYDDQWALLVASDGITDRSGKVNIEDRLRNPIAIRFDVDHLAASIGADPKRLCSAASGKVFDTAMGQVNIGHVMAGIDARLSGFPASNPHPYDPESVFKYDKLKEFSNADPTSFATFAGDMGQAYAVFLFTRHKLKKSATLRALVAQCAKPSELLGDIHGFIAAAVSADLRSSGPVRPGRRSRPRESCETCIWSTSRRPRPPTRATWRGSRARRATSSRTTSSPHR